MAENNNALNLTLGKGKLYFAEFAPGTQTPKGERFIGNCSAISIGAEVQTYEHRSSTEGRNKKDLELVTGVDRTGSITTDNMGLENVGIIALGYVERVSVSSATGEIDVFTGVEQGLRYQLGVSATKPEGDRKVASVVVTNNVTGLGAVTYVVNTDYTVDADHGAVTIVEGGAIADASTIKVTYNVTAHTIDRVVAGATKKEGTLRFVAANPDGPRTDYFIPWARLSPGGELSLISAGEDPLNMPIAIEVMEKDDLPPWIGSSQPVTS